MMQTVLLIGSISCSTWNSKSLLPRFFIGRPELLFGRRGREGQSHFRGRNLTELGHNPKSVSEEHWKRVIPYIENVLFSTPNGWLWPVCKHWTSTQVYIYTKFLIVLLILFDNSHCYVLVRYRLRAFMLQPVTLHLFSFPFFSFVFVPWFKEWRHILPSGGAGGLSYRPLKETIRDEDMDGGL